MNSNNSSFPNAVLPLVFQMLDSWDLMRAQLVGKEWHHKFTNPAVALWFHKQLVLRGRAFGSIPPETANSIPKLKRLHRVHKMITEKTLPALWSKENGFRDSCHYGKYSRWVLAYRFDDPKFIQELAWAVRLLSCLAPEAYSTLDGADTHPYDPEDGMRASDAAPGWHLIHNGDRDFLPQLRFDLDQMAGINALERGLRLNTRAMKETRNLDATNVEEHTKLLAFLAMNSQSLRALFWDIDGIFRRGANRFANADRIHPRQIPHMFHLVKMGKHVESLSWEDVMGSDDS